MTFTNRLRGLAAVVGLSLLAAACSGSSEDVATSDDTEALSGNPDRINIGFNGGPDQFAYTDQFFAASPFHPGPRLCHTYLSWTIAYEGPGGDPSVGGKRAWFEEWLRNAAGHCDEALVSFQSHVKGNPPTEREFEAAMKAFLDHPWAADTGFRGEISFTPWNEPNNPFDAGNGLGQVISPETAARYYMTLEKLCASRGCKVASGDFASNGNWWNDFEWNCANDNVDRADLCKQYSSENPTHKAPSYLDRYKNTIANHFGEYKVASRPKYFASTAGTTSTTT